MSQRKAPRLRAVDGPTLAGAMVDDAVLEAPSVMTPAAMDAPKAEHRSLLTMLRVAECYLSGWRDGRRRLPVPEHGKFTRLEQLQTQFEHACEKHRQAFAEATHEDRLQLAALDMEIERADLRHREAVQQLDKHLAATLDFAPRFGEYRMPADLVKTRRLREHARERTRLDEIRRRARNYLYQLRTSREARRTRVEQALEVARAGVGVSHGLYSNLFSAYIRGAERTHYNPSALLAAVEAVDLRRPAWVTQPTFTVAIPSSEEQQ